MYENLYEGSQFYSKIYDIDSQKTLKEQKEISKKLQNFTNWRCKNCYYKNYSDLNLDSNCQMCEISYFSENNNNNLL